MATKRAFQRNIRDRDLLVSFTGPVGAGATGAAVSVVSAQIDLGVLTAQGSRPDGLELVLRSPALGTGPLPGVETLVLTIESDAGTGFTGPTVLATKTLTGNTGAAADELRVGLGAHALRYVRAKVTSSATDTGNVSGSTFDFAVVA